MLVQHRFAGQGRRFSYKFSSFWLTKNKLRGYRTVRRKTTTRRLKVISISQHDHRHLTSIIRTTISVTPEWTSNAVNWHWRATTNTWGWEPANSATGTWKQESVSAYTTTGPWVYSHRHPKVTNSLYYCNLGHGIISDMFSQCIIICHWRGSYASFKSALIEWCPFSAVSSKLKLVRRAWGSKTLEWFSKFR